jgi:carboxypeptidase PM20D1
MTTDRAIANLQELIRIPTVAPNDAEDPNWSPFETFRARLETIYPLVHSTLQREFVGGHSMLFRWAGRSSERPVVLMAHYDVVPATDEGWDHPPFSAELVGDGAEQLIWGRGTLDDKGSLAAILEAVEGHLAVGHAPSNDIYLSFGHDEETLGSGSLAAVAVLKERGIRPALVLDEGGAIVRDTFPGIDSPMAVIGISEKGTTVLTLTVQQSGGHASTPPKMTSTVRLSRAIMQLHKHPFPAGLNPAIRAMITTLAPHARGGIGFAFRHLRVTAPLVLAVLTRTSDISNALTRTSLAVTMLDAGLAPNALAERSTATVNIRVAVGSSVAEAVEFVRKAINDDQVQIAVIDASEPSPISPSTGWAWDVLVSTIERTHPGVIATPYAQTGATDARHFCEISDNVYRFTPFEMSNDEVATLHAKNERMHVHSYLRGIEFYRALLAAL